LKKIFKRTAVFLFVVTMFLQGGVCFLKGTLPDSFLIYDGDTIAFSNIIPITAQNVQAVYNSGDEKANKGSYITKLRMFGIIPVKNAEVKVIDRLQVVLSGRIFGIKIFTDGVMVVSVSDIPTEKGLCSPAKTAGLVKGDIIVSLNGAEVYTNEEVAKIFETGKKAQALINRDGTLIDKEITPVFDIKEQKYRTGMWVRDSTAGIGTMTFYMPDSGIFAGLGHAVCDIETGEPIPINSGEIVDAKIISIDKSKNGAAGELCASFVSQRTGFIDKNSLEGVYGIYDFFEKQETVFIELSQNVKQGEAKILTTIDENGPQYFSCQIEQTNMGSSDNRDMIIRITDKSLLEKTGGIVQGMSGSPILQNGRLVGAITHVFVNDPKKGYGIFAEKMYRNVQDVNVNELKKAS